MRTYYADPHAMWVLMGFVPLPAGAVIGLLWVYLLPVLPPVALWLLSLLVGLMAVTLMAWLVPQWFRTVYYTVSPGEIVMHFGIIFRQERILRTDSLQYSARLKMPLSRYTGLNFIPLHAYGGSLCLAFLREADCDEIEQFLKERIYVGIGEERQNEEFWDEKENDHVPGTDGTVSGASH